ncbi:MAG: hypothetical protein ACUVTE_07120 [Candidatus Bathycorpusculaceae bacterium]
MRKLHDRLRLAKIMLTELKKKPLGRTELEKRTVKQFGTHSAFENMFCYLVQGGYMEKSERQHRAPYVITEKGLKLLEGL